MSNKTIYLSKDGKVFGPYSKEEYTELKRTPEFFEFSWIWTEESPGWVPINPPTVPPTGNTKEIYVNQKPEYTSQTKVIRAAEANIPNRPAFSNTQQSVYHHQPGQSTRMTQTHIRVSANTKIKAICHNEQQMISGNVEKINSNEFYLITSLSKELIPPFGSGHQVILNLLDINSGNSENVSAKVTDVKRSKGCWQYKMQWLQAPKTI